MATPYLKRQKQRPYKPEYALYAKLKDQWLKEHPAASPEIYTQAMIAIAQRCGI